MIFNNFDEKIEIRERCKGVHYVDLGESFPTSIYLQKSASIQPRTSLVKFARSPRTDPPGTPSVRSFTTTLVKGWKRVCFFCRLLNMIDCW